MKTILATICILWSSVAFAVDTELLVRVVWAQTVAERESVPDLPDDSGSGAEPTHTDPLTSTTPPQSLPNLSGSPSSDRLLMVYFSNKESIDRLWLSRENEGMTLGEAVIEWLEKGCLEDEPTPAVPIESAPPSAPIPPGVDALAESVGAALLQAANAEPDPKVTLLQTPLEDTGDAPDETQIVLFGFAECEPCQAVRPWLDVLREAGWTARYLDVRLREDACEEFGVTVCPTFIVFDDWHEVHRMTVDASIKSHEAYWRELCEVLEGLNNVEPTEAVEAPRRNALLSMNDLVSPILGKTIPLAEGVRIVIPQSLRWSTQTTTDGLRILFTGSKPRGEVDKLVTWTVSIGGLEFSRQELTLLLDGMPDVSVSFDWSN